MEYFAMVNMMYGESIDVGINRCLSDVKEDYFPKKRLNSHEYVSYVVIILVRTAFVTSISSLLSGILR